MSLTHGLNSGFALTTAQGRAVVMNEVPEDELNEGLSSVIDKATDYVAQQYSEALKQPA
jgi:hypothetical protein